MDGKSRRLSGPFFCFDSTTTLTEKNIFSGRKRAKSSALVVVAELVYDRSRLSVCVYV